MEQSSLRSLLSVSWSRNSPSFMEPKVSLPFSQQLATGHENQTNPVHICPPYFPKIHSNITLPSTRRSSEWSLPDRFSNQNLVRISNISLSLSCLLHAPSTALILSLY
jgi:hypothetical protein